MAVLITSSGSSADTDTLILSAFRSDLEASTPRYYFDYLLDRTNPNGVIYDTVISVGSDADNPYRFVIAGDGLNLDDPNAATGTITRLILTAPNPVFDPIRMETADGHRMDISGLSVPLQALLDQVYSVPGAGSLGDLLFAGDDSMIGGHLDDRLFGYTGNDTLNTREGNDIANGGDGDDDIRSNTGENTLIGGAGDDRITGGIKGDLIRGDAGADLILAGAGNDTVWAGGSDDTGDTVNGQSGDDVLAGGPGDDRLTGGSGIDTLFAGEGDDIVSETSDDLGEDLIWMGPGADTVSGSDYAETIGGGTGDDSIDAGPGSDLVYAGDGNDLVYGDIRPLFDDPEDGFFEDTLFGGAGDDTLRGSKGDDIIYNGQDNDLAFGDGGDDTLWGGPGDDTLIGGLDGDVFAFAPNNGTDIVADFSVSEGDKLDLSAFSVTGENLSEEFVIENLQPGNGSGAFLELEGTTIIFEGWGNVNFESWTDFMV